MKNSLSAISFVFCLALFSASCKKHSIPPSELSKLPAATQTGANTFGCLVNGKAFLPKTYGFLAPEPITCLFSSVDEGYGFSIGVLDDYDDNTGSYIFIETGSLTLTEGQTSTFKTQTPGNAYAYYRFSPGLQNYIYTTNDTVSGSLTITKIDLANRIVSGTFYFNGIDTVSNETTKITNGRFDLHYN